MSQLKEIENRYYKECNVIILPTNKPTNVVLHNTGLDSYHNTIESAFNAVENIGGQYQHLYIASNDEIKEGNYYIANNTVFKADIKFDRGNNPNIHKYPKIIATTDKSLTIKCIICNEGCSEHYHKCIKPIYLPQPSQSFIKKYCEQGGIDEVLVEYEEDNNPNLWGQDICIAPYKLKTDSHNTITIKPVKDSWSRKEVESLLFQYAEEQHAWFSSKSEIDSFNNWIKENL